MWRFSVVAMMLVITSCSGDRSGAPATAGEKKTDSNDTCLLLQMIVQDVLTDPALEELRLDYAVAGDTHFALVNNEEFKLFWPSDCRLSIPRFSYRIESEGREKDEKTPPLLGIRLDKFNPNEKAISPFEGNVIVTILNEGGNRGGRALIGGTSIHYHVTKQKDAWDIQRVMILRP